VNAQMVLTMGQEALLLMLMVSAPVLGAALVVGLLVSVFQAVTQINEATLAFVPKLIAVIAVIAVLAMAGPWMLTMLVEYLRRIMQAMPGAVA
jgi:flagellar biosynthesis protein FliQ